jgi:hypothetical protein
VGGFGGIERFANATLVPLIPHSMPGLWDECVGDKGAQWLKDPYGKLLLVTNEGKQQILHTNVDALYCVPDGALFRDDRGLWLARGKQLQKIPPLSLLPSYASQYVFTGAVQTADGGITATAAGGAIGRSIWQYTKGEWKEADSVQALPEITALHALQNNQVVLGFNDGAIAWLRNGHVEDRVGTSPNLGRILGFTETRYGLVAFGVRGLAICTSRQIRPLSFARTELAELVTGVVEAPDGSLWLNAGSGIVRIPASEMLAASRVRDYAIAANNIREGNYVGPPYPGLLSDRAQRDDVGRLWFSTLNGVVSIDPRALVSAPIPQLSLEDVQGDNKPPLRGRHFPPNVHVLTVRYDGIDFQIQRDLPTPTSWKDMTLPGSLWAPERRRYTPTSNQAGIPFR